MFDKLNYKESIFSNKLIFKKSWFSRLTDNIVWITMIIAFPVMSLSMLYGSIKFNWLQDDLLPVLISQLVAFGISSFLIMRLSTMDKLMVAKGNIDKNRNWIQEICKDLDYGVVTDNKNFLVAVLKPGLFAWHRYIYVIYNKDKVLLNCITYGLHGLKSPFHRMIDKRIVNKVITEFENKVRRHNNVYSA
ncbi:MAG: hypothetical protein ACK5M7_21145 [Draconibacterium sp.]